MDLTREQLERYSRHLVLPEVGQLGQERLLKAKVFIVGAGGLGCPVSLYLAAAGVGSLCIADSDTVELSNLQRQIAYNTNTLGLPKAESLRKALLALNPEVRVNSLQQRITGDNIDSAIADYDIVVDGSDNFPTRYLVNDACVRACKPLVSGGILRFEGQVTAIIPGKGHCYRCLFEEPPETAAMPGCQQAGVIGAIPGVIGSLMAAEVLRLILGVGAPLTNAVLIYDALTAGFRKISVPRNPDCPACGSKA